MKNIPLIIIQNKEIFIDKYNNVQDLYTENYTTY